MTKLDYNKIKKRSKINQQPHNFIRPEVSYTDSSYIEYKCHFVFDEYTTLPFENFARIAYCKIFKELKKKTTIITRPHFKITGKSSLSLFISRDIDSTFFDLCVEYVTDNKKLVASLNKRFLPRHSKNTVVFQQH